MGKLNFFSEETPLYNLKYGDVGIGNYISTSHNPEVVGSSPASATKENTTQPGGVFFGSRQELKQPPGYETDERSSLGKRPDRRRWQKQGGERSAAVGVQRSRTAG